MRILKQKGNDDIARLWLAETDDGKLVEFVESVEPPIPREQKWVLIVSALSGCPFRCLLCDAGGYYRGAVSESDLLEQIDFMVRQRYLNGVVPAAKFKIQFARLGDSLLNPDLPVVLRKLPRLYDAPGLMPCISTIAPAGCEDLLEEIRQVKDELYGGGRFQLQFSIHSTDEAVRDRLMPARKWNLAQIAEFGARWWQPGDRKITLNFAVSPAIPIDCDALLHYFDLNRYLVKLTPVNPTQSAIQNGLYDPAYADKAAFVPLQAALADAGYEELVSIGELEENRIGSNCGMSLRKYLAQERD
jgi:23S rRNA (adenine2503-C2)-methyltransferase